MKQFTTIIFILFIFKSAMAHNGTIKGTVVQSKNNLPIEAAIITLDSMPNATVVTNEFGNFIFPDIEAGEHFLGISILGYTSKWIAIDVKNHETTDITITLEKQISALKEVKIVANQKINNSIMGKLNLESRPLNSAQDVLKIVPGLFIAQHAGGGKAEQIFLRGFDCDHGTDILLSIDGMPINMVSHAHGQGYSDMHFIIPELIENFEVQKGSYYASNGDFSTAGSIRFKTKSNLDANAITIEKGMFNTNRILAMADLMNEKNKLKNKNLLVAGEYYYTNGYFSIPSNLNRMNLFSKYQNQFSSRQIFTMQASYFNSFWNGSGQIPQRAVANKQITDFGSIDSTEKGATSRANFNLQLQTLLNNNAILKNQLFFNNYQFNLYSNFTFFKNDTVNGDKIQQKENRNIIGYNGTYQKNYVLNKINLNTVIGIQSRVDIIANSELSNVSKQNERLKSFSLGNIKQLNNAIYMDENISLTRKFKINLGLRFDNFIFNYLDQLQNNNFSKPISKSILSPKFNVYYTLNKNVQLFLLSGKSFHSNDARVVMAQSGKEILPSAVGSEIGAFLKPTNNIFINSSLWYLKLQQEFVYVGDEAVVEASGQTKRLGIDLGIRYELNKKINLDADLNYAFAKALNGSKTENKIPLAPTFTSIGGMQIKINNQLNASIRYRYLANRAANESNTLTALGYTLFDGNINYSYRKFNFIASIENILNTNWREAQFETESRLQNESVNTTEINFTNGTPLNIKGKVIYKF